MRLKGTLIVAVLLFVGPGCAPRWAAPEETIETLGQAAQELLASQRPVGQRAAGPASLAILVMDVVLLESAGKLPSVAKLAAPQSTVGSPSPGSATAGLVAVALAANVNDLLRAGKANPFKNLQLTAGGKKSMGKYNADLFGAIACGTAPAAKNIKATLRLQGTTQQQAGAGVVFALGRVPLDVLGITPLEWLALCAQADDLFLGLAPAIASQARLQSAR